MIFELALLDKVNADWVVPNFSVDVYYGEAPESAKAPYIVMYTLDSDRDPQVLCDKQGDSGNSFVQFNVYHNDLKQSHFIKQSLDDFLTGITTLTLSGVSFTINRTEHNASPNAQTLVNGLGTSVLAKTFNYERV